MASNPHHASGRVVSPARRGVGQQRLGTTANSSPAKSPTRARSSRLNQSHTVVIPPPPPIVPMPVASPFGRVLRNTVLCMTAFNGYIYCADLSRIMMKWDARTNDDLALCINDDVSMWSFLVFGTHLYAGCSDGSIQIYNAFDQKVGGYPGPQDEDRPALCTVRCLAEFNAKVYSGGYDGVIRKWEPDGSGQLATLQGHTDVVLCLAVYAGFLYSGSADGTIRKWNGSDVCTASLRAHPSAVRCMVVFNNHLYSGSADSTIKKWNANDQVVKTLYSHCGPVCCLCVWQGVLFSGSADRFIKMWNAQDICVGTLDAHSSTVITMCVTDDGASLLTGGEDRCMKKWKYL
eukprot:TRINITY_DN6703_c0_g1_i2.p1 TRINITY_DN6703_c0_g1~~TRINITY_DN6703_c0_g1_i2.p1  ORF type:complete len:347 (-),score=29.83 TRINITY_DN6703_c0_g1_i2:91-1131(-)